MTTTSITTPTGHPRMSLTNDEGEELSACFDDTASTVHFSVTQKHAGRTHGASVSIPFSEVDDLLLALSEASARHRQNQAWGGFWKRQVEA